MDKGTMKTFHMGIDPDGVPRTGRYVRDWLKLQLAQGKRVLPMTKNCEGFDYQHGCPGHPQ